MNIAMNIAMMILGVLTNALASDAPQEAIEAAERLIGHLKGEQITPEQLAAIHQKSTDSTAKLLASLDATEPKPAQ